MWSVDESVRYARHFQLPGVGAQGQQRLRRSHVLVVGAGGLGAPVLLYLAAAGVGRITVLDPDTVALENLQRQVIHDTIGIGQPKVESARQRVAAINPNIRFEAVSERLERQNADQWIGPADIVVCAADNFPTRYLVNDRCRALGKPFVHGAVHRFQGEVALFAPDGPCYRCLHPVPPTPGTVSSCDEAGVLGVLPGLIGCLQAAETIKWLIEVGEPLAGRLMLFDLLSVRVQTIRLATNSQCPVCSGTDVPLAEAMSCAAIPTGLESEMVEITPQQLNEKMVRGDQFVLIDVREPHELAIAALAPAINVPLGSLPSRAGEFDPDAETVLMCRSGRRSADALLYLQSLGFTNLANLKGGILAWADDIDPTVSKY